jgi:hypothetical protein
MAAISVNTTVEVFGGSIRFGSLEFVASSVGWLMYVPTFDHDQAICFGSLEFIADQLGHLHLHSAREKPQEVPIPPAEGSNITEGDTLTVDLDALTRNIARGVPAHLLRASKHSLLASGR